MIIITFMSCKKILDPKIQLHVLHVYDLGRSCLSRIEKNNFQDNALISLFPAELRGKNHL